MAFNLLIICLHSRDHRRDCRVASFESGMWTMLYFEKSRWVGAGGPEASSDRRQSPRNLSALVRPHQLSTCYTSQSLKALASEGYQDFDEYFELKASMARETTPWTVPAVAMSTRPSSTPKLRCSHVRASTATSESTAI